MKQPNLQQRRRVVRPTVRKWLKDGLVVSQERLQAAIRLQLVEATDADVIDALNSCECVTEFVKAAIRCKLIGVLAPTQPQIEFKPVVVQAQVEYEVPEVEPVIVRSYALMMDDED